MTTSEAASILAYDRFSGAEGELINDKYSKAKYLGLRSRV